MRSSVWFVRKLGKINENEVLDIVMNYGLWCGLYLIFNGICCMVSLIYSRVGKVPSVGIGALIYGGLSHIVSYGVFGENGTQDVSKGRNGLFQN